MAGPTAALTWVEIVVGTLVICGAIAGTARSAYRGYVFKYIIEPKRKAARAHERMDELADSIDDLNDTVDEIAEYQELHTDVLIAVGETANNGKEFDVEQFRECVDKRNEDRFLQNDD